MRASDIAIESDGISLRHVTGADVHRARCAFRRLFFVPPVITVRGRFPAEAVVFSVGDTEPLNLLDPPHGRVERVGRDHLVVDLGPPLGAVMVDPSRGLNVEVRLTLPRERA
jgi:hypothetical protein